MVLRRGLTHAFARRSIRLLIAGAVLKELYLGWAR
jgi:hypothetical protein